MPLMPPRPLRRALPALAVAAAVIPVAVASGFATLDARAPSRLTHGPAPAPAAVDSLSSAEVLSLLPDGAEKRRLVLDCTGCHQFDARVAYPGGRARTEAEWEEAVARMLGYAGATTGFPVISAARDPKATAAWLARHLPAAPAAPAARVTKGVPAHGPATPPVGRGEVVEYLLPEARDLPHDVAIDSAGRVVVTGMMTHVMYVLDPAANGGRGAFRPVPIPVERANPRALDVDAAGRWWVALGAPNQVARHDPAAAARGEAAWRVFDAGMYAHSVAVGPRGDVWLNGHFTRAPELVARVDTAGTGVRPVALPPHPTLAAGPGGPIPYELRVARDGVVWMSELHGNRLLAHDPRDGSARAFDMPEPHMGPRRFDVDAGGVLWIPAYAAGALVRLDPRAAGAARFRTHPLPVRDAVPYVARVDARSGAVWIGTAAGDVVLRFDPRTERFTAYPLPSRGALVRHLTIDPRTGDVWLAYGASPGIAARIARLRPE